MSDGIEVPAGILRMTVGARPFGKMPQLVDVKLLVFHRRSCVNPLALEEILLIF